MTMYLTAGLLMALVFGYYLIWGKKSRQRAGIYVLILAGLVGGAGGVRKEQVKRWQTGDELYRANSNFGLLQVLQAKGGNRRFYLNDFLVQNTYDPESKKSLSMFTYMLHGLARAYTPALKDVLCIGLGVGIVPRQFAAEGASVDVVEINPAVVPLAKEYFDLPSGRFNIVIGDGRYFINRASKKYHAIVLDAFLGESSPSHLMTKEAFAAMQHILRPEGVLVINSFGEFRSGRDFFTASLEKTLRTVFRSVRVHHAGNGNVFFVASDQSDLKVLHQPNLEQVHPSCRGSVEAAFDGLTQSDPQHGLVLTDDFNPVDFYDAANREAIRRHLASSMRTM
jgi:spermidine synthase